MIASIPTWFLGDEYNAFGTTRILRRLRRTLGLHPRRQLNHDPQTSNIPAYLGPSSLQKILLSVLLRILNRLHDRSQLIGECFCCLRQYCFLIPRSLAHPNRLTVRTKNFPNQSKNHLCHLKVFVCKHIYYYIIKGLQTKEKDCSYESFRNWI